MSSGADVVAPGIGLPDGDESEKTLWQRAVGNVKSGNLGVLPVVVGEILIVAYFSFTATNFFTAGNFVNVILQMAGVTMIAFGVVFVLLIAEIDLSIGYLSGIAALTAATLQLPDGRNFPAGCASSSRSASWRSSVPRKARSWPRSACRRSS